MRMLVFVSILILPLCALGQTEKGATNRDESLRGMAIAVRERTEKLTSQTRDSLDELQTILPLIKKARIAKSAGQVTWTTLNDGLGQARSSNPRESQPVNIAFSSADDKTAAISEVQTRIQTLKQLLALMEDRETYFYGFLDPPLAKGNFGRLYPGTAIAKQRVDKSSVLVEYSGVPTNAPVRGSGLGGPMLVIVTNIPSNNVVLGQPIDSRLVFEVRDTKTFELNDGGSETVFVLEPLNAKDLETIARALK